MSSYRQFIVDNARWLGGGFLLTFFSSFGQTFFISLSGAEIRHAYGLSHGDFGGLYMLATLASAATLPLLGKLLDSISVARTVLLVVPMLALANASMAWSQSLPLLLLTLYLLRLFGQGMMTHTAMTAMGRWYSGHRGRAVSLVALGHQCGEALLPLLAISVFAAVGWRHTWLLSAALLLGVALPACFLLLRVERQAHHQDTADRPRSGAHWTRKEVLHDPIFWRLIAAVLAPAFIGTAIFFHQDYLLTLRGWPDTAFANAFVLLAVVTVGAGLLSGALIDRFGGINLLPVFLLPLALGCLVIWVLEAEMGIYVFMALLGCSYGMSSVLYGALWPEIYGTAHLGAVRSLITAFMVFSSALGPGVTGWLIDAGLPYPLQMLGLGVYCLLASAAMLAVRKQLRLRQPVTEASLAPVA